MNKEYIEQFRKISFQLSTLVEDLQRSKSKEDRKLDYALKEFYRKYLSNRDNGFANEIDFSHTFITDFWNLTKNL